MLAACLCEDAGYLGDVLAVDENVASLDVVETEHQPDDGALPRPRLAHLRKGSKVKRSKGQHTGRQDHRTGCKRRPRGGSWFRGWCGGGKGGGRTKARVWPGFTVKDTSFRISCLTNDNTRVSNQ